MIEIASSSRSSDDQSESITYLLTSLLVPYCLQPNRRSEQVVNFAELKFQVVDELDLGNLNYDYCCAQNFHLMF